MIKISRFEINKNVNKPARINSNFQKLLIFQFKEKQNKILKILSWEMNVNEKSWPEDRVVPPIEQSIDLSETYKTVENRYYSRFFYQQEDGEDQVVLVHSNRICLVSIAPNHPGVFSQFISRRYFL